jgi:hypothetical protein
MNLLLEQMGLDIALVIQEFILTGLLIIGEDYVDKLKK